MDKKRFQILVEFQSLEFEYEAYSTEEVWKDVERDLRDSTSDIYAPPYKVTVTVTEIKDPKLYGGM